jgi:hypothetical protein
MTPWYGISVHRFVLVIASAQIFSRQERIQNEEAEMWNGKM